MCKNTNRKTHNRHLCFGDEKERRKPKIKIKQNNTCALIRPPPCVIKRLRRGESVTAADPGQTSARSLSIIPAVVVPASVHGAVLLGTSSRPGARLFPFLARACPTSDCDASSRSLTTPSPSKQTSRPAILSTKNSQGYFHSLRSTLVPGVGVASAQAITIVASCFLGWCSPGGFSSNFPRGLAARA